MAIPSNTGRRQKATHYKRFLYGANPGSHEDLAALVVTVTCQNRHDGSKLVTTPERFISFTTAKEINYIYI